MVDPALGRPRWTISSHLTRAVEQIEQYVWQEVRGEDGTFKQVPKKENDDNPDALRYFLFSYTARTREKRQIIGYQGGDPITGYGRTPIYG